MDKPSIITYTVWSLDVWGHGSDECCAAYDCPCFVECETCQGEGDAEQPHPNGLPHLTTRLPCANCEGTGHVHDTDGHECDGGYTVNDRCKVGTIEVPTDDRLSFPFPSPEHTEYFPSDEAIVKALVEGGYLEDTVKVSDLTIDGEVDCSLYLDEAINGRPLLQLEYDSERPT